MANDQDNPTAEEVAGVRASQDHGEPVTDMGAGTPESGVVGSIAPAAPAAEDPAAIEAGLKELAANLTEEAKADAPPAENTVVKDITAHANVYRKGIKTIAHGVKNFALAVAALEEVPGGGQSEVVANISLAYRHLEDASQRLGKAIQAADGGVSVYDRETTVGA